MLVECLALSDAGSGQDKLSVPHQQFSTDVLSLISRSHLNRV